MSKIALSSNASGTGVFTIASPNSNTDRTLTLPDSTGTVATAESTLAQFNASGSAPVYACRAWVNFNGTGTVAIRASGNVSSITDSGTGQYVVNFTTAMPDTSYCASVTPVKGGYMGGAGTSGGAGFATTSVDVSATTDAGAYIDSAVMSVSIFR